MATLRIGEIKMAKRSKSWDESLAKKLKDLEFAKYYLLSLVNDENLPLKEALRDFVHSYGVSEYAQICGLAQPNLTRALNEDSNSTLSTVEKILSPLSLSLSVVDLIDSEVA